jgi:hypothetical protein
MTGRPRRVEDISGFDIAMNNAFVRKIVECHEHVTQKSFGRRCISLEEISTDQNLQISFFQGHENLEVCQCLLRGDKFHNVGLVHISGRARGTPKVLAYIRTRLVGLLEA